MEDMPGGRTESGQQSNITWQTGRLSAEVRQARCTNQCAVVPNEYASPMLNRNIRVPLFLLPISCR